MSFEPQPAIAATDAARASRAATRVIPDIATSLVRALTSPNYPRAGPRLPVRRSLAHVQPPRQMLRQVGGCDRLGGAIDVVVDPVIVGLPGRGVELEPRRPRVAVARLPDAARVRQPP